MNENGRIKDHQTDAPILIIPSSKCLPMDVEKLFHMSPGFGSTSYAQNSSFQKKGSEMAKHITMEALQQVCVTLSPKSIGIADLGCSSGPNTLATIRDFIEAIGELREVREVRVYLNDLPSNDFNSVFRSLPDLYKEVKCGKSSSSVYIAAYPGSFYGRLFPNNYLHFVYSSFSLHWLSKVPPGLYDEEGKPMNKGSTYICESSPAAVAEAYLTQFKEDFSLFLQSRAQELSSGGCMVLILLGRADPDHADRGNSFFWQLLSKSFSILVSQGEVGKEKVDSYDVHFYAPSRDEIEAGIERDGSFELVKFEMFEPDKGYEGNYGKDVAMTVRAVQESMISHHFGEHILDPLFNVYERIVDDEFLKQEISPISFAIVLRKL